MVTARWWSQPVAAEGSSSSEGIRRQLGKPRLDPLTVLVRETAQNTCDAALPEGGDVHFGLQLKHLSGQAHAAWRELLLPEPEGSELQIGRELDREPLLLLVTDRGTTGLGGPLRADTPPEEGVRPDFVNFVRNVGERKHVDLGGGSYGFGKGILYNVSRCHMIIVDSVCSYQGRRQRRLIGAALGDGYTTRQKRFTGRHWLGIAENDGHTRPLLDEEADELAARLGLPRFADGDTGTTIAVVAPDLGQSEDDRDRDRNTDRAAEFLASTMVWNLWPRMLGHRPHRLVCSVKRDGFAVPVPDPEQLIELKPFVDAYRQLDEAGGYKVPPRKVRPTEVGRFAIAEGMSPSRANELLSAAAPFQGPAHHCARMRQADLVVDYVAGEPSANEMVQYGAVFRASAEADPYFAESEPPTHDDWVTSGLSGTALGVVRLAQTFVNKELQERSGGTSRLTPSTDVPLGRLATQLAGLIATEGSAAQATVRTRPSAGGGARLTRPRFVDGPKLLSEGGTPVIWAVVKFPTWQSARRVVARPRVVTDGALEELPNAEQAVLGWRALDSGADRVGADILLTAGEERIWELRVRPVADSVVRIDLQVREVSS